MKLSTEEKTLDYFNNLAKGLSHPDLYESKGVLIFRLRKN